MIPETVEPAAPLSQRPAWPKFWKVTPLTELPLAEAVKESPEAVAPAAVPLSVSLLLPTTDSGTSTAGRDEARLIVVGVV